MSDKQHTKKDKKSKKDKKDKKSTKKADSDEESGGEGTLKSDYV